MADFLRQLDIIHPDRLVYPITCIGLGGIGSFVAAALRKMGFRRFDLYDGDIVEPHNVPCQNFGMDTIGNLKVDAVSAELKTILGGDVEISTFTRRFEKKDEPLEGIVVSGVDSMAARKIIWDAVQHSRALVPLYVDGRIGVDWNAETQRVAGEWIEIFTIKPSSIDDVACYEQQLFDDGEAAPFHCTAQAVIYIGYLIAGFMAANVKKWIVGEAYPRHLMFDVLTMDMLICDTVPSNPK